MEYAELATLLGSTDFEAIAGAFIPDDPEEFNYLRQYHPHLHNIHDPALRPDKLIMKPDITDPDGKRTVPATVKVSRLSLPLQKYIVKLRAQFLLGNAVILESAPVSDAEKSMLEGVQKIWDDNKLDYKSKYLAKLLFSETQCAELWYADTNDNNYWQGTTLENVIRQSPEGETITDGKIPIKYRMRVLARSLGDNLYPVFDQSGDMIAFGRGYETIDTNNQKVQHLDIYTNTHIHQGTKPANDTWQFIDPVTHGLGKIPVIYYAQDFPEWFDVEPLINRLETQLSNLADTNDYFGSPTAVATGNIIGYADKGESGKMVQLEGGAKMEYLTWDAVPESTKMEMEKLETLIYNLTSTPVITFETLKGLGRLSGIALKMLFMGAHMEASDKEEIIGECFQRRINLLKQFVTVAANPLQAAQQLTIKPKFTYYLPKDSTEILDNITAAVTIGAMSHETAIELNPLIEDPEAEKARVEKEQETTALTLQQEMQGMGNNNNNNNNQP